MLVGERLAARRDILEARRRARALIAFHGDRIVLLRVGLRRGPALARKGARDGRLRRQPRSSSERRERPGAAPRAARQGPVAEPAARERARACLGSRDMTGAHGGPSVGAGERAPRPPAEN